MEDQPEKDAPETEREGTEAVAPVEAGTEPAPPAAPEESPVQSAESEPSGTTASPPAEHSEPAGTYEPSEPAPMAEYEPVAEAPAEHAEPVEETAEEATPRAETAPAVQEQPEPATAEAAGAPEKPDTAPPKPAAPRITDLHPGIIVEGTVSRIERYGAFVKLGLAERRDGLIHISELAPGRVRRVEDVVQVGAAVRARVVSVDLGRGRVALSLNDLDEQGAGEASAGPSEPALTSMQQAFQRAQADRRERERREGGNAAREDQGSRRKKEQEELIRRLRAGRQ